MLTERFLLAERRGRSSSWLNLTDNSPSPLAWLEVPGNVDDTDALQWSLRIKNKSVLVTQITWGMTIGFRRHTSTLPLTGMDCMLGNRPSTPQWLVSSIFGYIRDATSLNHRLLS